MSSPRPTKEVADEVASRARGLNNYMRRLESLHASGDLSATDVKRAQAGALLAFHTYVERSLERLFLGVVMNRLSSAQPGVTGLVHIKSEVVARAVVSGGRNYVDWLPFDQHTMKRADAFLSAGRPFSGLSGSDISAFDRLGIVRNAIAHESSHAVRKFRKTFVDGRGLPPEQQTPAGYLRATHHAGQSRFENMMADVVATFIKLCD